MRAPRLSFAVTLFTLALCVLGVSVPSAALAASVPVVEGVGVSGVETFAASIEAQVDPEGQPTTCELEYGTTTTYGTTLPCEPQPGEGSEPQHVSVQLRALQTGTTYDYRFIAENASGPVEVTATFTTIGLPGVQTGAVQSAGETTAALSGTVDAEGGETTYRFRYVSQADYREGAEDPYADGASTGPFILAAGYVSESVGPVAVSELEPGTTYVYALAATNEAGTKLGEPETFTTAPAVPAEAGETTPAEIPAAPAYTPSTGAVFPSLAGVRPVSVGTPPAVQKSLPPTRSQKLAKALGACRKKAKGKRAKCERQARKAYGPVKKQGKK
jgi:trimeric autotransporter adhesin